MGPDLDLTLVVRLLLASVLGGMIGLEREIHGRPAGFRTHLLVSLGACLFVIASIEIHRIYGNGGPAPGVDPGRVAAQVVTGIGFLGAGAIIREKASIRGLTTAACLWVAAALGLACGIGLFYLAICVTLVALASLLLLKRVEHSLPRDRYFYVKIWGEDRDGFRSRVDHGLAALAIVPIDCRVEMDVGRQILYLEFQVRLNSKAGSTRLVEALGGIAGVRRVRVD